ncbi:hypothetical protein FH972_023461 [Carpinus fangiana]|uniref:Uncharacterized protein n=1 Tax=Carpinus fangiana TaxID=176857 RepID=A0A5N6KV93_9ROSI|nr:hypothetical protein FH972_023461 [Carpinus fangiana]
MNPKYLQHKDTFHGSIRFIEIIVFDHQANLMHSGGVFIESLLLCAFEIGSLPHKHNGGDYCASRKTNGTEGTATRLNTVGTDNVAMAFAAWSFLSTLQRVESATTFTSTYLVRMFKNGDVQRTFTFRCLQVAQPRLGLPVFGMTTRLAFAVALEATMFR